MNILKSLISIKRPEAGKQYTEPNSAHLRQRFM